MKLNLFFASIFCSPFLFSCMPPKSERVGVFELFKNLSTNVEPLKNEKNRLNGVWHNKWTNEDGYPINEFIIIDKANESFLCVLNTMGGYEYSPISFSGDKILTTFIDPQKEVYVNSLSTYGKWNLSVELNYDNNSDTLKWSNQNQGNVRKYSYDRLSSTDIKLSTLFNSTCAKALGQKANTLKIEKLEYTDTAPVVSLLHTSQTNKNLNYCVFNTKDNTVLSLPVKTLENDDIVFSNLDVMETRDRKRYFKSTALSEITQTISPHLLSLCAALTTNTRSDVVLPNSDPFHLVRRANLRTFEAVDPFPSDPFGGTDMPRIGKLFSGSPTSTYLVCNYRNLKNGVNSSWEWGEYPKWEWESQRPSCGGFFSSNCMTLNGEWAREDNGPTGINTMFIMDTSSLIESDFSRACNAKNRMTSHGDSRKFAQYYVSDSSVSFNHSIWFKKPLNNTTNDLPFNRIVAFGDSLSDNGNLHNVSGGLIVTGGYYQGRFSNGPVWVEYLSKKLNVDLYDWAVSAAVSDINDPTDFFKGMTYTAKYELYDFIRAIDEVGMTKEDISKMLFTVLYGGNNFVRGVRDTPEEVLADIKEMVNTLLRIGAQHVMLVNLPDLSMAPKFSDNPEKAESIHWKVMELNRLIGQLYSNLQMQHLRSKFYYLDLYEITDDAARNPAKFYLTNIVDPCNIGKIFETYDPSNICDQPQTYLFWDKIHPATTVHCQVSDYALNSIFGKYGIPAIEPSYKSCVSSFIY